MAVVRSNRNEFQIDWDTFNYRNYAKNIQFQIQTD